MTIFKNRKKSINVLLKKIASQPFRFFCFLLLVSTVIAAVFFLYCETVFVGIGGSEGESVSLVKGFNSVSVKNVFDIWKQREQDFKDADSISYPDLFKNVVID
ncbi:MAG: hypothetical protein NTX14_01650 [Candidatus Nealsonbacteria bacterium]|nr:hypothetical protein [Candidatus Nealsonbacteria bacterium]